MRRDKFDRMGMINYRYTTPAAAVHLRTKIKSEMMVMVIEITSTLEVVRIMGMPAKVVVGTDSRARHAII